MESLEVLVSWYEVSLALGTSNLWLVSEARAVLWGLYSQNVHFVSLIVVVCWEIENERLTEEEKRKQNYLCQWQVTEKKCFLSLFFSFIFIKNPLSPKTKLEENRKVFLFCVSSVGSWNFWRNALIFLGREVAYTLQVFRVRDVGVPGGWRWAWWWENSPLELLGLPLCKWRCPGHHGLQD